MAAEALEQREREKMRRITGRDISDAKEKQKEMEMKKAFEQKKREQVLFNNMWYSQSLMRSQEEEKIARARVKAQIEADKKARAEKASCRVYISLGSHGNRLREKRRFVKERV